MKSLVLLVACVLGLVVAGCEAVDLAPAGNPERVLTGAVRAPAALPAGAEVVVRVVDTATSSPPTMMNNDLPIVDRGRPIPAERILGESRQKLTAGTIDPVPFQIEYHAEDSELRRGLNVDVRVTIDGRVRYRTISAHVLTLGSAPFPQEVPVQPLE
jgi:uncharacterized lipoprotein YbaY